MESLWFELFVIFALLLANGVFAMSEIAMVSARKAKLQNLEEQGDKRAASALDLAKNPGRFLSTVRIGITSLATLAAAYGGVKFSTVLAESLRGLPWLAAHADGLAITIVVIAITYFSVVLGEHVPKRLALNAPEKIAIAMAAPMRLLSRVATPVVWSLEKSSDVFLKLLGVKKVEEAPVSEEELRIMIGQGTLAGVFKKAEAQMVEGVLDLDESTVDSIMTPRARMVWLNADDKDEDNWRRIAGSGHSHFPVFSKTRENVLGMVSVKALWANLSLAGKVDLRSVVMPPLYVPATMPATRLFEEFKRSGKHIALVVDEFGVVQGLVSLHDLLEEIVGQMPDKVHTREPQARRREDGKWVVDALLETEPARAALGIRDPFPGEEEGDFRTIGGFVLRLLSRIPKEGERVHWGGFTFEVVGMERQRIDKLLVSVPKPVGSTDVVAVIPPQSIAAVDPSTRESGDVRTAK